MATPIEGGCLCGEVRYRVEGTPTSISICHCQSCRRAGGSPAMSWFVISRGQFTLLAGKPVAYRSSAHVLRTFCGKCGTQLAYEHDSARDTVELTTGSLDHPSAMAPTEEIWLSDKLPWVAVNQNLDHHWGESLPAAKTPIQPAATPSKFKPLGWNTVTPRVIAVDAQPLVEFVKKVFGATGDYHPQAPAELKLGDSIIMISDAGVRAPTSACLYVYVADTDATWRAQLTRARSPSSVPRIRRMATGVGS
jgi:hypothetical protein